MPPPRCSDYRAEMRLVELKRRLQSEKLTEAERSAIMEEIKRMEVQMGLD